MKFVFFGTPEFAAIVLQELMDAGMPPAAVVCNPDRPVGRKHIITPPPIKRLIARKRWRIDVLQPEKPETIYGKLHAIHADFFLVAAYAKILRNEILAIPSHGTIGIHPSLLPKYRGPTPVQAALLDGAEETGVSLFAIDEKVDHGPIIASVKCRVSRTDTYQTLLKKLAKLGGECAAEILPKFLSGNAAPHPQDENTATYTRKFTAEDGFVDPQALQSAEQEGAEAMMIDRKIRALNPEPGVYTLDAQKKRVKLLAARIDEGKLVLTRIQREGKTPQALMR